MADSFTQLRDKIRAFAREREWEPFHTPKNLSMALIVEAAELVEHFQWLTPEQSAALDDKTREEVAQEVADILIYLTRLADVLGIDLAQAADNKLALNARKYPVEKSRGSAAKYTEL
jgi:NTP pyrophosphatase (non-canonical NTP hydrolase)